MTVERQDLERAASMALATLSSSQTPKWLADMAWETYKDMAWNLQFNDMCSETGESKSGLLLWPGAYWFQVEAFLDRLPDEIKLRYPADVMVAGLTEPHPVAFTRPRRGCWHRVIGLSAR
jgi:hypothetical protein